MPDARLSFDASAPKRATNVSLNSDLLEQAKTLGINVSRACERGLIELRRTAASAKRGPAAR